MLEATEDGIDERPASSPGEESPAAIRTAVADRLVYKLVKVGDDGSVLAATEDEVFQSLVGGSSGGLSSFDAEGSDGNEEDDDEEGSYADSEDEDSDGKPDVFPLQDPAAERKKLRARLEGKQFQHLQRLKCVGEKNIKDARVVDTILLRVEAEEQQRIASEDPGGHVLGPESNSSPYFSAGDGSGDKRQRRPNPKYFDFDSGIDPASGGNIAPGPLSSSSGEPTTTLSLPEKQPSKPSVISPRVTSGWGSHRSSVRSASTHRARTAVAQKPFTRTSTKVEASGSLGSKLGIAPNQEVSLDNLSIRELHEAFRTTYGRDTSVKDKHWLKRQISAGWMKQRDAALNPNSQLPAHNLKARVDQHVPAEQPLPSVLPATTGATDRDAANEAQVQGSNGLDPPKGLSSNGQDTKRPHRRPSAPPAVSFQGGSFDVSPPGSLNGLGAGVGQIAIYGEVVNTGEPVGGKRQRKPNRRYIEDENEAVPGSAPPANGIRSATGETGGNALGLSTRLSWRTVETDGPADMIGRHGTLRGSTLRNATRANLSQIQRAKPLLGGLKRKVEGRAAKLVKMAHSTARAARQDADGTVRKVKFRLPTAAGMEKDGLSELNGGAGDQVSCLLPVLPVDSSGVLHALPLDSRAEGELPIATVPTANGGTRRKHHRPWTLREVMTLVEGVARCGGGKWADIKKLAFAAVGYRTAVDLKMSRSGRLSRLVMVPGLDKWRNLLRASRAQLHPPKQGERKKQFTAAIPAPILARVRELAALQNQMPPTASSGGSTSRSGRTVHRK